MKLAKFSKVFWDLPSMYILYLIIKYTKLLESLQHVTLIARNNESIIPSFHYSISSKNVGKLYNFKFFNFCINSFNKLLFFKTISIDTQHLTLNVPEDRRISLQYSRFEQMEGSYFRRRYHDNIFN